MRILITGVTGRIGANLASSLVQQGHDVRGLVWARDARTEKLAGIGLDLVEGTLTDPDAIARACAGVQAIYHLGGAFQGGGPFTPAEYFDINVRGTFNVLEAAKSIPDLVTVAIASTDAVYEKYLPDGMTAPVSESMPAKPAGYYAVTKSLAEDLGLGYARSFGMPVVALRFALVVGAGEFATFSQFHLSSMKSQRKGLEVTESVPVADDALVIMRDRNGRPWRKHVADVRDIVGGCVAALDHPAARGHAIQLGAPEAFDWDTTVPYLAAKLGRTYVDAKDTGTPTYYEFDLTRCRSLLGYQPQYGTHRMIDDAVAYLNGSDINVVPTG